MLCIILNLGESSVSSPRQVRVGQPLNRNMGSVSAPFTFVVTISCTADTEKKRKTSTHIGKMNISFSIRLLLPARIQSLHHNYLGNFLLLLCAHSDTRWYHISCILVLASWGYCYNRSNVIINTVLTQNDWLKIDSFLNDHIFADLSLPSP